LWILQSNLNIQTVVNSTFKLEYTNSCEFYLLIGIYKQLWILPSNWNIQTVVNSTCKLQYTSSCEFYLQIAIYKQLWILPSNCNIQKGVNKVTIVGYFSRACIWKKYFILKMHFFWLVGLTLLNKVCCTH